MADKLFSCVIPNYNGGAFLEEAIQSLLHQNADDLEIIVCDGGSTDNSVEIIKKYADRIAWWCSEKDGGQSNAMNKGFARATGKYLFWLNSDDIMLDGALDAVRAEIRRHLDTNWITGHVLFADKDMRTVRCSRGSRWHDFLYRRSEVHLSGPTSFFTKDLFYSKLGRGFDESFHYMMDSELWVRFRELGARYSLVDAYLFAFRMHDQSKTTSAIFGALPPKMAEESQRLRDKYSLCDRRWFKLRVRMWRLLTGSYLKAKKDLNKLRQKI